MTIFLLIIGISALILIHEFGHFAAAKFFGLLVEEFGLGFPPRLFSKKIGETLYSVNLLPFGGFVKIHGEKPELTAETAVAKSRSFAYLPVSKRAAIIVAGVVMNFLFGALIMASVYAIGVPNAVIVGTVSPDSPAAHAGMASGDKILGFEKTADFIAFVDASRGAPVDISFVHDGQTNTVPMTPRMTPPEGEGALGISITDTGIARTPVFVALWQGFIVSGQIIYGIAIALVNLVAGIFTGSAALENVVGPVGIFSVAQQTAQFGLVYLLQLIALISLNLTVLNAIPIPALDGGRLLFLLIEKIKG